jgi:hypothetical protein
MTEFPRLLTPSKEQRIHQLLTLKETGDWKPFQFLRHLRRLVTDVQTTSSTTSDVAG